MIMNDVRLRGFAVAGSDAAGRKTVHNHAQIARNLRRSLRNAAAGARLIQADGLDSKSAADIAASLADALTGLHRLELRLNRRIRRDIDAPKSPAASLASPCLADGGFGPEARLADAWSSETRSDAR